MEAAGSKPLESPSPQRGGYARRLVRSIRQRGALRTMTYAVLRLWPGYLRSIRAREEKRVRTRDEAAKAFDLAHGVETGGLIHPKSLQMDAEASARANGYEAILPGE